MAEGVLFNVAELILTKLGSLALQEIGLLWGLQDELKRLQRTLETIKAVLLDAEKQYHVRDDVKVWLDALKDVVYDADDLLDDFSTEILSRQLKSGNVVTKEVQIFFSRSNRIPYGLKMAHKIKDIRAKLDEIAGNRMFHLNQNPVEPRSMDHSRDSHSSAPHIVIGREDDKKNIISLLLDDHKEDVVFIPIVGMGGLGKTTLAQLIYNDEMVKEKFELKVWVCVSDIFDVKSIIQKIIGCIDGDRPSRNMEMEVLKNMLSEKTKEKKYLFVLDDIWNEDREKWTHLSDLITCGARGSRIIVTTRSKVVADITCTSQSRELKGLSELESWDLFRKVAFKQGQAPNEVFEKLGEEIVAKCGGLPLAIRTIGSLLYTKRKESEWQFFKDEEFSSLDPKKEIIEILKLSYNHLPSNLKHCFAYCSLFPKNHEFDVSMLIDNWNAHGYVDSTYEGVSSSKDKGYNYLKYLVQRSFFHVDEENEDGEIMTCRMHDYMHDLATSVAGEEVKLLVYDSLNGTSVRKRTRHISLHNVPSEAKWQDVATLLQGKRLRTLIVRPETYDGIEAREELLGILAKLKYLRVLDLPLCKFKKLPSFIGRLKHLRLLELFYSYEIARLPSSITRLHNLEVLNLDKCRKLKVLPRDMKKLVNLINLGLNCDELEEMPRGIGQLTSLEVLPQFILTETKTISTGGLDELQKLNKLRGTLNIFNLQNVENGARECKAANLQDKPNLQYLMLHWKVGVQDTSIQEKSLEALEALRPHVNLRELLIRRYGGLRFPRWVSSMENLVSLVMYECHNCKSLPLLDGLSSLQHLEVRYSKELEYMIDRNENTEGAGMSRFFPNLKTLILSNCLKLRGWWRSTEEQLHYQMPCLYHWEISLCPNLNGWMPHLPSLNTLKVNNVCSDLLEGILEQAKPYTTSTSTLIIEEYEDMNISEENNTELIQHGLGNLNGLQINDCAEMRALPQGIQHLKSLQILLILFCTELEALPAWMCKLASLNNLQIVGCPQLSERCRSNQGEDWPLISHIPNIKFHDEWVQRNGRYLL